MKQVIYYPIKRHSWHAAPRWVLYGDGNPWRVNIEVSPRPSPETTARRSIFYTSFRQHISRASHERISCCEEKKKEKGRKTPPSPDTPKHAALNYSTIRSTIPLNTTGHSRTVLFAKIDTLYFSYFSVGFITVVSKVRFNFLLFIYDVRVAIVFLFFYQHLSRVISPSNSSARHSRIAL